MGGAGLIGLQRAVGNAALSSVLAPATDVGPQTEGEVGDEPVQREMSGGESPKPMFPSSGEGEEDI
jgi:hypothetical protein